MGNEDEYKTNPGRGSGSKPVEKKLHAESHKDNNPPLLEIDDPNTHEKRFYGITDNIRKVYQRLFRRQLEKLDAHWYDMWWEGTELVIEYSGPIRTYEMRENQTMWPPIEEIKKQYQGGPGVVNPDDEGFCFDAALFTMEGSVRLDIQERADRRPLAVEDQIMFVEEGVEPVKTTEPLDEEIDVTMPENMDFEDHTNDSLGELWGQ